MAATEVTAATASLNVEKMPVTVRIATNPPPDSYTFFDRKQADDPYAAGDIYDPIPTAVEAEWELEEGVAGPYFQHVKSLSLPWPHLRLLSNFMEIGTTPARWNDLKGDQKRAERNERAQRTNVTRLDYLSTGKVNAVNLKSSDALKDALVGRAEERSNEQIQLRLFVVEDLSRDVIEHLGASLDIEPEFFREHIVDYAWYNTRDPWVDPPNLQKVARRQRWIQMRYVTARYFQTTVDYLKARREAQFFNVLRRPDDDQNNNARWDKEKAIVAITRSRASFWLKRAEDQNETAIGVLLLDPTVESGLPLWQGYRNWEATPSMSEKTTPPSPPRTSIFNDFIYWAQRPDSFRWAPSRDPRSNVHVPAQALLHLVCVEWLTMASYIKTRLGQIDWEIAMPEHFLQKGATIDVGLQKLHTWRRLVPLYREMLGETLERVFCYPWDSIDLLNGTSIASVNAQSCNTVPTTSAEGSNAVNGEVDSTALLNAVEINANYRGPGYYTAHQTVSIHQGPINAFHADFKRALSLMEEYQQRIDRMTRVVASVITIKDSRRGLEDNRNLARLTLLGFFYIPLSFMSSLFSMQPDIPALRESMQWYFAGALPLAVISLTLAWVLTLPKVKRFGRGILEKVGLPSGQKGARSQ